jgi:hypothetical protein
MALLKVTRCLKQKKKGRKEKKSPHPLSESCFNIATGSYEGGFRASDAKWVRNEAGGVVGSFSLPLSLSALSSRFGRVLLQHGTATSSL